MEASNGVTPKREKNKEPLDIVTPSHTPRHPVQSTPSKTPSLLTPSTPLTPHTSKILAQGQASFTFESIEWLKEDKIKLVNINLLDPNVVFFVIAEMAMEDSRQTLTTIQEH